MRHKNDRQNNRKELARKITFITHLVVMPSKQGENLPFEPGTDDKAIVDTGFHVPLTTTFSAKSIDFSTTLELNGSQSIRFSPLGKDTDITLQSDWPDPSFQGNWLPATRNVSENGFKAHWKIPFLGRNFPQQWNDNYSLTDKVKAANIGVDFLTPVDNYRMTERSVKYETLFLLLTFAIIWLFELICKLRIHPVQYLFIGAAICLLYVLELSLSEHLGFLLAYITASIAIVCMVASYACVVLKTGGRASIVATGISMLYGYLYVLLQEKNYALLIGSIGLFIVLGSVMYLTRNIDWYGNSEVKGSQYLEN
ncbi:MAG: cell envelope integrity protein CreD [Gammaproteobacteria bacterium]|nr:cell envelope integrity protein CreD [Gammaproteobacteria bacterium]